MLELQNREDSVLASLPGHKLLQIWSLSRVIDDVFSSARSTPPDG
jgi:hypothetical protein